MIAASAELAGRQGGKLGPEDPEQLLLAQVRLRLFEPSDLLRGSLRHDRPMMRPAQPSRDARAAPAARTAPRCAGQRHGRGFRGQCSPSCIGARRGGGAADGDRCAGACVLGTARRITSSVTSRSRTSYVLAGLASTVRLLCVNQLALGLRLSWRVQQAWNAGSHNG
jgi:hypothetical protein